MNIIFFFGKLPQNFYDCNFTTQNLAKKVRNTVILLTKKKYVLVIKNIEKLCQSTQNSLKHWEMWFFADVLVCVCGCVLFSTFQTSITHKRLEISIWNSVHHWNSYNPSIVTIDKTINGRFVILWDFDFFEKCTC